MRFYLSFAGVVAGLWGSFAFAQSTPLPLDAAEGRKHALETTDRTAITAHANVSLSENWRFDPSGDHALIPQRETDSLAGSMTGTTDNRAAGRALPDVVQSSIIVAMAASGSTLDGAESVMPLPVESGMHPPRAASPSRQAATPFPPGNGVQNSRGREGDKIGHGHDFDRSFMRRRNETDIEYFERLERLYPAANEKPNHASGYDSWSHAGPTILDFFRRNRLVLLFGVFVLSYMGSTLTFTRKNAANDLKQ